jgi:hypothetical protein
VNLRHARLLKQRGPATASVARRLRGGWRL